MNVNLTKIKRKIGHKFANMQKTRQAHLTHQLSRQARLFVKGQANQTLPSEATVNRPDHYRSRNTSTMVTGDGDESTKLEKSIESHSRSYMKKDFNRVIKY